MALATCTLPTGAQPGSTVQVVPPTPRGGVFAALHSAAKAAKKSGHGTATYKQAHELERDRRLTDDERLTRLQECISLGDVHIVEGPRGKC